LLAFTLLPDALLEALFLALLPAEAELELDCPLDPDEPAWLEAACSTTSR
jgi:hypothetical protein